MGTVLGLLRLVLVCIRLYSKRVVLPQDYRKRVKKGVLTNVLLTLLKLKNDDSQRTGLCSANKYTVDV